MPCPLSVSLSKSGPFPRPALPGVFSRTDLSATRPARPAPHGGPVGACTPPIGLPVLLRLPSSMHAGTPTPAETVRCICRFSSRSVVGLPLISGGSAPALPVSRPARCSHHIPACMVAKLLNTALCHQSASVYIVTSVGRPGCYQPKATIVGWGSHPPGKRTFPRRTEKSGLAPYRRSAQVGPPGDFEYRHSLRRIQIQSGPAGCASTAGFDRRGRRPHARGLRILGSHIRPVPWTQSRTV